MAQFTLAKEHFTYFKKQQFIELEGLFSSEELNLLKNSLLFPKRNLTPEKLYLERRDLWRKNPLVKKVSLNKQLAHIAASLTGEKFIRLGYDQLLSREHCNLLSGRPINLESISSIQGVVCGVLVALNTIESSATISRAYGALFPTTAGNVVYFTPQKEIDFFELLQGEGQEFLLIAYAEKVALYIPNEADPNVHAFKELGYVFGDRLNDQLNPVLYR